jgi:hypothetical protein
MSTNAEKLMPMRLTVQHWYLKCKLTWWKTMGESSIDINVLRRARGARERARVGYLVDSVQSLVFEQGRNLYARNFFDEIRGVVVEAACRKFVFNGWLVGQVIHNVSSMMGRSGVVFDRKGNLSEPELLSR